MTYRYVLMIEVEDGTRQLLEVPRRLRPILEELDRLGASAAGTVLRVSKRKGGNAGVIEIEIDGYRAGVSAVEILALVSELGLPALIADPEELNTRAEEPLERSSVLDDLLAD